MKYFQPGTNNTNATITSTSTSISASTTTNSISATVSWSAIRCEILHHQPQQQQTNRYHRKMRIVVPTIVVTSFQCRLLYTNIFPEMNAVRNLNTTSLTPEEASANEMTICWSHCWKDACYVDPPLGHRNHPPTGKDWIRHVSSFPVVGSQSLNACVCYETVGRGCDLCNGLKYIPCTLRMFPAGHLHSTHHHDDESSNRNTTFETVSAPTSNHHHDGESFAQVIESTMIALVHSEEKSNVHWNFNPPGPTMVDFERPKHLSAPNVGPSKLSKKLQYKSERTRTKGLRSTDAVISKEDEPKVKETFQLHLQHLWEDWMKQKFPHHHRHVIPQCPYENSKLPAIDFYNDGKDRTCLVALQGKGANCCPRLTSSNSDNTLRTNVHDDARVFIGVYHHHQSNHYTITLNCYPEHFDQNPIVETTIANSVGEILFGLYVKQQDCATLTVKQLDRKRKAEQKEEQRKRLKQEMNKPHIPVSSLTQEEQYKLEQKRQKEERQQLLKQNKQKLEETQRRNDVLSIWHKKTTP